MNALEDSPSMNLGRARHFNIVALIWAVCAALAALACGWLLRNTEPGVTLRLVYAAIPVTLATMYLIAVVKSLRALDELHRRIQFEAVAFAFVATMVLSLLYGMLQKAGFFRGWAWDWEGIWGLMLATWVVGQVIAKRRYAE